MSFQGFYTPDSKRKKFYPELACPAFSTTGAYITFGHPPTCSTLPTLSTDLVTKAYADSLATGISWKVPVNKVFAANSSLTAQPKVTGQRFVTTDSADPTYTNKVLTWGTEWWSSIESVTEGYAVRVVDDDSPLFANQSIVFNGTTWVNFATGVDHDSLIGVPSGSKTHTQINAHLDNTTNAHFGQNLSTTSAPTFSSLGITNGASVGYLNSSNSVKGARFTCPVSLLNLTLSGQVYNFSTSLNGILRVTGGNTSAKLILRALPDMGWIEVVVNHSTIPLTITDAETGPTVTFTLPVGATGRYMYASSWYDISNSTGQDPTYNTLTVSGTGNLTYWKNGAHNASASCTTAGGLYIATTGGQTKFGDTVNSTSSATGSVVIAGGLGVAKDAFIEGILTVNSNADSTGISGAAFYTPGGATVTKSLYVGGVIRGTNPAATTAVGLGALRLAGGASLENTTDAQSSSNGGSLTVAGGAAIGKSLFVGTSITAGGTISSNVTTGTNACVFLNSGMTSGNTYSMICGKAGSSTNSAVASYAYNTGTVGSYVTLGPYGYDGNLKLYASGGMTNRINKLATYTSVYTGGSTYSCVIGSTNQILYVQGSGANTVKLFDTTTIIPGWNQTIVNKTSGVLTVQTFDSVTLGTLQPNMCVELYWDNSNWVDISAGMSPLTGGTATAILGCTVTPTSGNHLCNKTYVDGLVGGAVSYATTTGTLSQAIAGTVNGIYWVKTGRNVIIHIPTFAVTPTAASTLKLALVSYPSGLPVNDSIQVIRVNRAGTYQLCFCVISSTNGSITFYPDITGSMFDTGVLYTYNPIVLTYLNNS